MKTIIMTAVTALMMTNAMAQAAHAQVQVSAQVNAYVRASNTPVSPTIQTNSQAVKCTVENKEGYTLVTC